jgi:hypothetical protein
MQSPIWEPERSLFVVELGFKADSVSICDRHVVFADSPLEALGQGILMSVNQTLSLSHWRVYSCRAVIEQGIVGDMKHDL